MSSDERTIDDLIGAFYAAFRSEDGGRAVDSLYGLFIEQAVIVNATSATPSVYALNDFVEPRRALLASGELAGFREYEVSATTDIVGRIARRTSRYEKTWMVDGKLVHGAGRKFFSLVSMPDGWKIASVVWYDDP